MLFTWANNFSFHFVVPFEICKKSDTEISHFFVYIHDEMFAVFRGLIDDGKETYHIQPHDEDQV